MRVEPKGVLFSKRKRISELVEDWCGANNASLSVFNIVTALDALGCLTMGTLLDDDLSEFVESEEDQPLKPEGTP